MARTEDERRKAVGGAAGSADTNAQREYLIASGLENIPEKDREEYVREMYNRWTSNKPAGEAAPAQPNYQDPAFRDFLSDRLTANPDATTNVDPDSSFAQGVKEQRGRGFGPHVNPVQTPGEPPSSPRFDWERTSPDDSTRQMPSVSSPGATSPATPAAPDEGDTHVDLRRVQPGSKLPSRPGGRSLGVRKPETSK